MIGSTELARRAGYAAGHVATDASRTPPANLATSFAPTPRIRFESRRSKTVEAR
jgi:hypothetical protein